MAKPKVVFQITEQQVIDALAYGLDEGTDEYRRAISRKRVAAAVCAVNEYLGDWAEALESVAISDALEG